MQVTRGPSALVGLALGLSALAATSPAIAALGDRFVVDTQFDAGPSTVTDATGVFSGCSRARDLFGSAEDDGEVVRFVGGKRLACGAGATVLLVYDVVFDPETGATAGTWHVSFSTLDGLEVGSGGGLMGTRGGCTVEPSSDGCTLDTFTLAS